MQEYPFLTVKSIQSFPPGLIASLGGIVSARSVKLLGYYLAKFVLEPFTDYH